MEKFEPDKDFTAIINVIGNSFEGREFSTAISGDVPGELLNELYGVLAKISSYTFEKTTEPEPSKDTPWRIWWKKLDKDGKVVDHGVFPNKYRLKSNAERKGKIYYDIPGSPYEYKVSQSVPWPELGYFKKKNYSNI